MGYIVHHTIIVTGWHGEENLLAAHGHARALFGKEMVSDISPPVTNSYASFSVFPDGSKDGWEESNTANENRATLIAFLRKTYLDWAEVRFGDEHGPGGIENESREEE